MTGFSSDEEWGSQSHVGAQPGRFRMHLEVEAESVAPPKMQHLQCPSGATEDSEAVELG